MMKGFLIVAVLIAIVAMCLPSIQGENEFNAIGDAGQHQSVDVACGWFPGKLLLQRRANAKARGGWYLGKFASRRLRSC